jgi:Uma2 family endonuclease
MPSLATLISPIIHSPQLAEITQRLQQTLDDERRLRNKFYSDMTPELKIEFIDGEVILHSPARLIHLEVTSWIHTLLHTFVSVHQAGKIVSEKCLVVFPRNDYEPDIVYFSPAKAQALQAETMKFPIPDLVVEVLSESTEQRDRGVKFEDFEAHGVQEYWIVDAEARLVEQYVRQGEILALNMKSGTGELRSQTISGFAVPVRALFEAEENLSALRGLLAG